MHQWGIRWNRIHSYELTLRLADAGKIEITDVRDEIKMKNQIPKEHPGLGEGGKYHEKQMKIHCRMDDTDICTGRKSELREDDTVQPADRLESACGKFPGSDG